MKVTVIVFLLLRCYNAIDSIEEHYWRDFNGLVPSDAIPSDRENDDKVGMPYIGQFSLVAEYNTDVSDLHTVVATIKTGKQRAIAAYNGRSVYSNETSNLKIMCTDNQYKYQWKAKNSLFSPNCRFVVGGYEDNTPLYVGRATKGKEQIIGKVFADTSFHSAQLMAPYEGGIEKHDNYQILTFCS